MPMSTAYPVDTDDRFHPCLNATPKQLTATQVEQFNELGYINDLPLFSGARLRELQAYFPLDTANIPEAAKDSGKGFRAYHHEVPELYDIATDALLVAYIQDLLGPDVGCHTSAYINKTVGASHEVVWHQDATFNPMDAKCLVVWLAIDDADQENGCMWGIPGAHQRGIVPWDRGQHRGHRILDVESLGAAVPLPVKAGHVLILSDLLPHYSGPNHSSRPRPSVNLTYASTHVPIHCGKNQWCVVCTGENADPSWIHHPRPVSAGQAL